MSDILIMKLKRQSKNIRVRCILWLITSTFLLQVNYLGLSYKSVHGLRGSPSVPDAAKFWSTRLLKEMKILQVVNQ